MADYDIGTIEALLKAHITDVRRTTVSWLRLVWWVILGVTFWKAWIW